MSGLPPVDRALLPADVRGASRERQGAYAQGLAFEQVLVGELAETMLPKRATAGAYGGVVTGALTDALTAAGGLGLARGLADAIAPEDRS